MADRVDGVSATSLGAVTWRRSAHGGAVGDRVESAGQADGATRDSRLPTGPALVCTRAEIAAPCGRREEWRVR